AEVGTSIIFTNDTNQSLSLIFDPTVEIPRVRIAIPEGAEPFVATVAAGEGFIFEPTVIGSYRFALQWSDGVAKAGEIAVVEQADEGTVDVLIVGMAFS